MNWEYDILFIEPSDTSIASLLNKVGANGWENYAIVGDAYFLKRIAPERSLPKMQNPPPPPLKKKK